MDATYYTDPFVMKGMEYVIGIAFLIALVLFWRYLNRPTVAKRTQRSQSLTEALLGPWFLLPGELYYHRGHTWARPEADNVVRIGMDDFAQKLVGIPSAFDLPRAGALVAQGDAAFGLRIGSRGIRLLSPVDGEVVEVNEEIASSPGLVNRDPYGSGWLLKVRVPKPTANLKNLLSGRLARRWMEQTTELLRLRLSGELGTVLQDGGMPVTGFARLLAEEHWDRVAAEFLLTDDSLEDNS